MSKKGLGPPQILGPSKPPPPPPPRVDEDQTLAFTDAIIADVEPDVGDLLSSAFPNGLSNPYAAVENGWFVGWQEGGSYTGAAGASGPFSAYTGTDVDAFTAAPAESANANPYVGGQSVDPSQGPQNAAAPGMASGGNAATDGANGNATVTGQTSAPVADLTSAYRAATQTERSQLLAGNLPLYQPGGAVYNSDHGFPVPPSSVADVPPAPTPIPSVQTIASVTIIGDVGQSTSGVTMVGEIGQFLSGLLAGSAQTISGVTTVSDPTSYFQGLTVANQQTVHDSELTLAMQDAVGQPSPLADPAPSNINEVLSGTNWMSPQSPQAPPAVVESEPITPYDPLADSPLARALLRGDLPGFGVVPTIVPALDFLTNDTNLRRAQTAAEALAITGAVGAGLVAAAGAAPAVLAATKGFLASAAAGAQSSLSAPLLAGAIGTATNPRVQEEAEEIEESLPAFGNSLGGYLSQMGARVSSLASRLGSRAGSSSSLGRQVSNALAPGGRQAGQLGSQIRGNLPSAARIGRTANFTVSQLKRLGWQFHHWFPRQLEERFDELGIDVHQHTTLISQAFHIMLHSEGWNEKWANWLDEAEEKGYNADQAVEELYEMLQPYLAQMAEQGITGPNGMKAIVPYPR